MASRRSGPRRAFRIADMRFPLFDGAGAQRFGARWNSPGRRVIYAAETYAGALLEVLVHASGRVPQTQGYITIDIPAAAEIEVVTPDEIPNWDASASASARNYGDRWHDERRTVALIVPSVVTRFEGNILINPEHPDFPYITSSPALPVRRDSRLWTR